MRILDSSVGKVFTKQKHTMFLVERYLSLGLFLSITRNFLKFRFGFQVIHRRLNLGVFFSVENMHSSLPKYISVLFPFFHIVES